MSGILARLNGRAVVIAIALILLVATLLVLRQPEDKKSVTAHFPRAVSVYKGSDVRVLGVNVGRVTAVDSATSGQVRTARVTPYADLGALDLLQVVVEGPRGEPRVAISPAPVPTPP